VPVRRALISVSDKSGLAEFAASLNEQGVEIISTGGTLEALREAGIEARPIEDLTGFPEMMDGRLKTLHPVLHGGLLAVRDDPAHTEAMEEHGMEPIDLVCVNLYPFEETIASGEASQEEAIEKIDIGGPTMIRAAAKNHRYVAVVVDPSSYDDVAAELRDSPDASLSAETRRRLAADAFASTAAYDAAISKWFEGLYEGMPSRRFLSLEKQADLSYGENPHQSAALYVERGAPTSVLSGVSKLHGKALSFNNVLDLDSARGLLEDLIQPACVIVKHNNPCGAAEGDELTHAYEAALACDPTSAFGGVVALGAEVDAGLAERLSELFIEVLIAPGYSPEALEVLQRKEAIRILRNDDGEARVSEPDLKRVRGGALVQDPDDYAQPREEMEIVTKAQPSDAQWEDLLFAWRVCRRVRSNAIVLAADRATLGIGAGQMSRVDSVRIAVEKAREARGEAAAEALAGSVVASDAFFPFADGPQIAIEAGATAIIQPGGSKRDDEVIAACDEAGVAMAFTGNRHFRH